MRSFLDIDYKNYKYILEVLCNYNLSYLLYVKNKLLNNYPGKIYILRLQFKHHKLSVIFNHVECCYEIWISRNTDDKVLNIKIIYALKACLKETQSFIDYYHKYENMITFA